MAPTGTSGSALPKVPASVASHPSVGQAAGTMLGWTLLPPVPESTHARVVGALAVRGHSSALTSDRIET
jgi:hypothetical protein